MSRFGSNTGAAAPVIMPVAKPDGPKATPAQATVKAKDETKAFDLLDAKLRVHAKLIDELDLSALDKLDDGTMRQRGALLVGRDFLRRCRDG